MPRLAISSPVGRRDTQIIGAVATDLFNVDRRLRQPAYGQTVRWLAGCFGTVRRSANRLGASLGIAQGHAKARRSSQPGLSVLSVDGDHDIVRALYGLDLFGVSIGACDFVDVGGAGNFIERFLDDAHRCESRRRTAIGGGLDD